MPKKPKKRSAESASRIGSVCSCRLPERSDVPRMMLSLEESILATGVGRDLLYVHIRTGALTSVLVGRRRLIRVADLEAWVQNLPASAA